MMMEVHETLQRWMQGQEFYDLMQTYRHAKMSDQESTVAAFAQVQTRILAMIDLAVSLATTPSSERARLSERVQRTPGGTREEREMESIPPAVLEGLRRGELRPLIDAQFAEVDEPEQRFRLVNDARLVFWRQAFLTALPEFIRAVPHDARGSVRAATEAADTALAHHLMRNDLQFPDTAVDVEESFRKGGT